MDGSFGRGIDRMTCRRGIPSDGPAIFDCLLAMEMDHGMGLARSDARIQKHIDMCVAGAGGLCGVIDGLDGRVIATVGIIAMQTWYSDTWFLNEIWLFVRPEYRQGGRLSDALFRWAMDHKEAMETSLGKPLWLISGPTSFKRTRAKLRLWERYGRVIGGIFLLGDKGAAK